VGCGYSLPVSIRLLARQSFLESLVQIGCVAPRLLTRLSPGDDMIPDEGIMACPIWIAVNDNLAGVGAFRVSVVERCKFVFAHGLNAFRRLVRAP
jgi:hypothetical protein